MSTATALVRLLLNASDYSKGMDKAQRDLEQFIDKNLSLGNIGKNVVGVLGKMAAAAGVAGGGIATFTKVMRSSQATSDAMDASLRAAKGSVDLFFQSISTGDFSRFDMGLKSIIEKAKAAAAALDQLWNTQQSHGFRGGRLKREMQEMLAIISDEDATTEDKKAASERLKTIKEEYKALNETLKNDLEYAVKAVSTEKTPISVEDIDKEVIEKILSIDSMPNRDELKARLQEEYKEYLKRVSDTRKDFETEVITYSPSAGLIYTKTSKDPETEAKIQKSLVRGYREAILYNQLLQRESDDWLKELYSLVSQIDQVDQEMAQMERTMNRGIKRANTEARKTEQRPTEKRLVPLRADILAGDIVPLTLDIQVNGEEQLDSITAKLGAVSAQFAKEREELAESVRMQFKQFDAFGDKIGAVGDIFTNVGTAAKGELGAMMSYIGGVANATAQAVPVIMTMIELRRQQANAATKAAAAEAAASMGWLGPISAIAAITSVVAAMASIPSFAEGGIVPGTNYRDGIVARVSSGEMVMNQADQKRLYDTIHSGNAAGGENMVVVRGEQLVEVINNYGRRSGKGMILRD